MLKSENPPVGDTPPPSSPNPIANKADAIRRYRAPLMLAFLYFGLALVGHAPPVGRASVRAGVAMKATPKVGTGTASRNSRSGSSSCAASCAAFRGPTVEFAAQFLRYYV